MKVGEGPVRTGVTAILLRGKKDFAPVFAGWFSLNGNGGMIGKHERLKEIAKKYNRLN